MLFQDGQKVILIGDSITDCGCRDSQAPFGNGYVHMAIDLITARYPERDIEYINQGIGGNTVLNLRDRWTIDVVEHQPDWLTVKIGINDLHQTLGNPNHLPPARYEQLYREVLERARTETSAQLVLIDPFYMSVETDRSTHEGNVMSILPEYLAVVAKMAEEFDALHVLTHERFQEQLRHRPASYFCGEPVHPNARGHYVIALALLDTLGW